MSKYIIWDKVSPVYTLSGRKYTPEEWIEQYAWADIPGVKMIISGGSINGAIAIEFSATKEYYKKQGCEFTDDMTDQEVLDKMEEFDNTPKTINTAPSIEERTAAALEFIAINSLPDVEEVK